jgi:hypothetical protein
MLGCGALPRERLEISARWLLRMLSLVVLKIRINGFVRY